MMDAHVKAREDYVKSALESISNLPLRVITSHDNLPPSFRTKLETHIDDALSQHTNGDRSASGATNTNLNGTSSSLFPRVLITIMTDYIFDEHILFNKQRVIYSKFCSSRSGSNLTEASSTEVYGNGKDPSWKRYVTMEASLTKDERITDGVNAYMVSADTRKFLFAKAVVSSYNGWLT
jgi:hypothetical protein